MGTAERLVTEAAALLDAGGDAAVTLRAVAQAVGVSHNAPYRHHKDRNALLAAVAERDFRVLTGTFEAIRASGLPPLTGVQEALEGLITYGKRFPARYRLLFSDPDIGSAGGRLEEAATQAFTAFALLVEDAQRAGVLPATSTFEIAGLMYATVHGLITLEASGRMRKQKGLSAAEQGLSLLLALLGNRQR